MLVVDCSGFILDLEICLEEEKKCTHINEILSRSQKTIQLAKQAVSCNSRSPMLTMDKLI